MNLVNDSSTIIYLIYHHSHKEFLFFRSFPFNPHITSIVNSRKFQKVFFFFIKNGKNELAINHFSFFNEMSNILNLELSNTENGKCIFAWEMTFLSLSFFFAEILSLHQIIAKIKRYNNNNIQKIAKRKRKKHKVVRATGCCCIVCCSFWFKKRQRIMANKCINIDNRCSFPFYIFFFFFSLFSFFWFCLIFFLYTLSTVQCAVARWKLVVFLLLNVCRDVIADLFFLLFFPSLYTFDAI